ncbi:MAG: RNA polymerase-associated protein RapA [Pseudomonas fluorescens]|nr:MAG: RNA polymerase-associated protein RapA [Pseudomonas fluorescens]
MIKNSNAAASSAANSDRLLMPDDAEQFPPHLITVLCLLALLGELSKSALLENMHALGVSPAPQRRMNPAEMADVLDVLQGRGWLQKKDHYWHLTPGHDNAVFLHLLTHRDIWQKMQQCTAPMRGVLRPERARLWLAILAGDADRLSHHLAEWMSGYDYVPTSHPVARLFADDAGRQVLSLLDGDVQALLLATFLSDACYRLNDCTDIWQFACDHLEAQTVIPEVMRGPMALQALWRDERGLLDKLAGDSLPLSVTGWTALCRGDKEGAMAVYLQLATEYRKATRKRKLQLPPLPAMMVALTLLTREEPAHARALSDLTRYAVDEGFGIAWVLLKGLLRERDGTSALPEPPVSNGSPFVGMPGILQALALFWHDNASDDNRLRPRLTVFHDQLVSRGYRLPAYEIRTLLHLQFDEPAPTLIGERIPLCLLWQRKPAWEYALDALGQLTPQNNASTSRLAWLLTRERYGLELAPLEQKRNKQGWSKGRPIALKRLRESADTLPWLLAQDRQAVRHIRYISAYTFYGDNGSYTIDAMAALPQLVGHPAVFWHDAPDVRIDIEPGQVTLVLSEEGNQFSLRLTPAINENQHLVTEKETPTRLVVYPVTEEHRRIAAIVGKGLRIPAVAREKVLQSVSSIAPLLPVRTDLPELMTHIPHVSPDETIYAHLLPLGEGLRLQLLVRPLTSGAWLPPGRGNKILNGEQDGQAVQTQRDLQTEQQRMQQVLRACPLLATTEPDNTEWHFTDPQDALEALTQLRAVEPALLGCVWPEGERMRIAARHTMHSLNLNIRRQGEWFALSGELALDDGRVLQLRQLLALLQESRGRFIHLGEQDWLALDNQLRQRLLQIALLAGGDGKNLTLNALTLPFLKDLADEAGNIDADEAWHQHLRQLETREKHQPALPSTLKAELRDYQQEGVCWLSRLAHWGVGACLADDMGLGKTLQALALLLERAPGGPQLVVAPTSVTYNWLSESKRFAPTLQMRDYRRSREIANVGAFDVVVVSYGLLLQDAQTFAERQWHSVVLDEAQAIKNAQTQRARAVMALQADFRLALSGTPIENHLGELWSLFRFLNPGLLGGLKPFSQRFVGPIEQGDRLAGTTLKQLIKPFMLRRTKAQVLDELPSRTDILHKIPQSDEERHWYEALRQQAVEKLERGGDDVNPLQVLTEITRLRRFCCHPSLVLNDIALTGSKLSACMDIISELRENHHKALVFSQFVDHLKLVQHALDEQGINYQYLDGSTAPAERTKRVEAFQSGEGDLFLISLKAGGTGLNLTAADYVIHLDPWWNPAVEDQASDRAHRMGQSRPVTVYRLVMEGTIEEQIVALHSRKRQLASELLEGSDSVGRLDTAALLSVLRGQ